MALQLTTKQRAYLRSLAVKEEAIFQIGKEKITPELITAIREALDKRELIKLSVLKNNDDDIRQTAETIAERTHSVLVQIMGRKITLYKMAKKPKIKLPRKNKDGGKTVSS
ncbi:MAG: YhbY family RNA-binding protein [Lachnospiraceae bacterium]|nr:YhbY family RNA-binding protein [Lachnospiraceae bacterium]